MAYSDVVLATSGLQSYWRLDETAGTSAADSQGAVTGTYSGGFTLDQAGVTTQSGNKSVLFDGSTGKVSFGDVYNFSGNAAFSVEAWVHTAATLSGIHPVIASTQSGFGDRWALYHNGVDWIIERGNVFETGVGDHVLENTTYYVAMTYDGTTLRLYVNGVDVRSGTASGSQPDTADDLKIGENTSGNNFSGRIDEVAVYNVALPAATVLSHYEAGTGAGGTEHQGAASLSGTGSLTGAGTAVYAGAAALSGTGSLTAAGGASVNGAVILPASGTATSSATLTAAGQVELFGSGVLAATALRTAGGAAALSGSGSLTAAAQVASVVARYSEVVAETAGLQSYWRLDDTTTTAADAHGAVTGTYSGTYSQDEAGLTTEPGNSSVEFTNGGAAFGDVYDFAGTAAFSVEAWVAPTLQSGTAYIAVKGNSFDTGGWNLSTVNTNSNTLKRLQFTRMSTATANTITTGNGSVTPGQSYHFVATYDGMTMRVYLNGVLAGSVGSSLSLPNTAEPLRLAQSSTSYVGHIDEVAIYNVALDAATILDHYQAGSITFHQAQASLSGTGSLSASAGLTLPSAATFAGTASLEADIRAKGGSEVTTSVTVSGAGRAALTNGSQSNVSVTEDATGLPGWGDGSQVGLTASGSTSAGNPDFLSAFTASLPVVASGGGKLAPVNGSQATVGSASTGAGRPKPVNGSTATLSVLTYDAPIDGSHSEMSVAVSGAGTATFHFPGPSTVTVTEPLCLVTVAESSVTEVSTESNDTTVALADQQITDVSVTSNNSTSVTVAENATAVAI